MRNSAAIKIQRMFRTRKQRKEKSSSYKTPKSSKSPKSTSYKTPKSPKTPKFPKTHLYPETSFFIDGITLHYFTTETHYENSAILTYIGRNDYEELLQPLIRVTKSISGCDPGNRCGPNSSIMCKHIKRHLHKIYHGLEILDNGIYFMSPGKESEEIRIILEEHYGNIGGQTTSHYHAIPYMTIRFNDRIFHVAIESTYNEYRTTIPYRMQFFVALDEEKLFDLLKVRYQYNKLVKTDDCSNDWMMVYR